MENVFCCITFVYITKRFRDSKIAWNFCQTTLRATAKTYFWKNKLCFKFHWIVFVIGDCLGKDSIPFRCCFCQIPLRIGRLHKTTFQRKQHNKDLEAVWNNIHTWKKSFLILYKNRAQWFSCLRDLHFQEPMWIFCKT